MMTNDAPAQIAATGLVVKRGDFVLRAPDWQAHAGEIVGLVGANGAGKTSFINALVSRLPSTEGRITLGGIDTHTLGVAINARVGVVPEDLLGINNYPVADHLEFLSQIYPSWDSEYADSLVERMQLPKRTQLRHLSTGTRLKTAFVSAEAFRPTVLILDEPTSGVDPHARQECLAIMAEAIAQDPTRTIVFSTHLLEDISQVATTLSLVRRGLVHSPVAPDDFVAWKELDAQERYPAIAGLFGEESFD